MDWPDPLARLEELEIIAQGHAACIERQSQIIKEQSQSIEQLTGYMIELTRAINSHHKLIMEQGRHIRTLNASRESSDSQITGQ